MSGKAKSMARKLLIVGLALFALSGPTHAFFGGGGFSSAAIVAVLKQILSYLEGELLDTLHNGFEQQTVQLINDERFLFNQLMNFRQQPSSFCTSQTRIPGTLSKAAGTSSYGRAVSYYNQRVQNSGRVSESVAEHNEAVRSASKGGCDPRVPTPIEADEGARTCEGEALALQNEVLSGVISQPMLPEYTRQRTSGQVYEATYTTNEARRSLAAMTINNATSEEQRALIEVYRKLLASPSVEELNQMTADGSVARDQVVLQQVQSQLLLNLYVQSLETNRLLGVLLQQNAEDTERNYMAHLRNNAMKQ